MGHPTPGIRRWRKSVRESGVSRAAIHFADWLVRHPIEGSPGMYASNQKRAAAVLNYSERTVRSAFGELVAAGLVVVVHRGIRQRPETIAALADPADLSQHALGVFNRQLTPG